MGVYHYSCAATGISLWVEPVVGLLLCEDPSGRWVPASLPVRGSYNQHGSLDGIPADLHSRRLAAAFAAARESGTLVIDNQEWNHFEAKYQDLERVFAVIERGTSGSTHCATWNGRRLIHTLISARVYDAIVDREPRPGESFPQLLNFALAESPFQQCYAQLGADPNVRSAIESKLAEFVAFKRWYESVSTWRTEPDAGGQHSVTEFREKYSSAIRRFRSDGAICAALSEHAEELEEIWPHDYPEAGWVSGSGACAWVVIGAVEGGAVTDRPRLSDLIKRAIATGPGLDAVGRRAVLLEVHYGVATKEIDLRSLVRVDIGETSIPLFDARAGDLLRRSPAALRIDMPRIESRLSPLENPALPVSILIGDPVPAWAGKAKVGDVLIFHQGLRAIGATAA